MIVQALHRTTYNAVLGRLLIGYRNQLNLDQKQMSDALGMSQSAWSRIETGETSVTVSQLGRISRLLNVTPQSIIEEVERARTKLQSAGVEVMLDKPKKEDTVMALLAGAALGVILVKVLSSK